MAVIKTNQTRTASIKMVTHVDGDGNEKYVTRSVGRFKTAADLEDVNEVALAISSLTNRPVKAIYLTEKSELDEI